jgi:hypothetical protein
MAVGEGGFEEDFHVVVAAVGVLVAIGRQKDPDVPAGVPTAYFTSTGTVPVNAGDPALRPYLFDLLPAKLLRKRQQGSSGYAGSTPFLP